MVKKCIACNGLLDNDLYCRNCRLVNPDFKKGKPFYSNFSRRAEKGSVSRKMLMLLLSCAILIVSYVALPSFVNFVEKSWAGIVYIVVVPGVFILVAIGLARLLSKKCPDCGSAEVDLTSNKTLRRTHKYKSTIVHTWINVLSYPHCFQTPKAPWLQSTDQCSSSCLGLVVKPSRAVPDTP